MAETSEAEELEREFSELALALFSSDSVAGTLQRIVDRSCETVDGCDAAGMLVVEPGGVSSATITSPLVAKLDAAQIEFGEGPCFEAARTSEVVYVTDLLDGLWPKFGPVALELGVRSVLAYPLLGDRLSALNLYGRLPAAFGSTGRAQGLLFATLARLALEAAETREAEDNRAANLHSALRTRELIGQAQGILMQRDRINADQAFGILRKASQALNIKLRDVAEQIVYTGEEPAVTK